MPIIRQGIDDTNTASLPQATDTIPSANINSAPKIAEEGQPGIEVTLKFLASSFAERYGSFSNQTDFKNLKDLTPLMTSEFSARNNAYIKQKKSEVGDNSVYYGVTSKTVKTNLVSLNEEETAAELELTMQRREARGSMNSNVKVFYQDIVIKLKKESGEWKVDGAEWIEK
jgi:hypothetical protein